MSARTPTAEPESVKESTPLAANSPLPVAATRIEAEIDTALAELHRQHDVAAAKAQSALDSLHYVAGDRPRYRTRTIREWGMTREAVLAFVPPANALHRLEPVFPGHAGERPHSQQHGLFDVLPNDAVLVAPYVERTHRGRRRRRARSASLLCLFS